MIWIGTSGYSYAEWKGTFYPKGLPSSKMLAYYVERFSTVEVNVTFYRMPTADLVAGWAAATPERFAVTLKAPRRITHERRLRGAADLTAVFCERARLLGPKLGALLFQLPPFLKKDVPLLEEFLATLPAAVRVAFEFRHASWHDDAVYAALARAGAALCIADGEKLSTPFVPTARYGYLRLRDEGYEPADLARWARAIEEHLAGWDDVFVYFKHEESGKGPALAAALAAALRA
jgi:uncharacterized protein YecE (DUF72 family)